MGITRDNKLIQRLREPSSMAGIAALAMAFGAPATGTELVVQLVSAVAGLLAIFLPERGEAEAKLAVATVADDVAAVP